MVLCGDPARALAAVVLYVFYIQAAVDLQTNLTKFQSPTLEPIEGSSVNSKTPTYTTCVQRPHSWFTLIVALQISRDLSVDCEVGKDFV